MMNVMSVVVMLMFISVSVVFLISWINSCFVVMLVVSCMVSVIGWMKSLMVLMMISIGINGVGVFCGSKWVSDVLVLLWKFVIMVFVYSGMVMFSFIDSCVVGVNEWGSSFSSFVDLMNKISDISINVYVCFLVLWMFIICFDMSWSIYCWSEMSWLFISWFGVGNSKLGNSMMSVMSGSFSIMGVMKEVNSFLFILFFSGCFVLVFLLVLVLGCGGSCVLKFLVESWWSGLSMLMSLLLVMLMCLIVVCY